VKIRKYVLLN